MMSEKVVIVTLCKVPQDTPVMILNIKLNKFREEYPDFEVFYDGDKKAIVGIKKEVFE